MEGQDLESVGDEQAGEANVVEDTEDPDEDELRVAGAVVGCVRVVIDSTGDGPADERANHAEDRDQEERTTAELVDLHGGNDGDSQIEDGLASGDAELLVLLGDTGALVDGVHVVGEQSITRVLGDDTEGDDDGQPPAVTLGAEEVHVGGGPVGLLLDADGLLDLLELELDGSIVGVATSVPGGKDVEGLLVPVLVDEETGGLGDEPDEGELDEGGDDLDEGDGTPRPVVVDVGSSPSNAGHEQGTQVPQAVVDGRDGTTVLRVADLSEEKGRGHLGERVAETQDETTTQVHYRKVSKRHTWPGVRSTPPADQRGRRGRKDGELTSVAVAESSQAAPEDHEGAADHDGDSPAVVVGNVGGDEEGDNGTDVEHVDQDAELVGVLDIVAEVLPPFRDLLGDIDEHTIVTGGGRGDHQHEGIQVELPQMGLLGPVDLLEARGLSLSDIDVRLGARDANVGRHRR